jgi:DNA-binding transcriptional LysR family regulator
VPGALWLAEHAAGARVVLRGNSLISALNAITIGMGIGSVPCFMAADEPTLRRLSPEPIGSRDIWLVYHPDRAKVARVRAVMDFLVATLASESALLRG